MSERAFIQAYGRPPTLTADAPGRVNLMGEHTDYNGGSVLPVAIPQRTTIWLAARQDATVQATSAAMAGGTQSYRLGDESAEHLWIDYVQGCTHMAMESGLRLGGFDAWLESTVPVGSGLSSSAALEVALLRGLRALFQWELDDVGLARLAQQAETQFVGAKVGIMDQMAAGLGDEKHAVLLDTFNLQHRRIPLPVAWELVVIDSGIRHSHAAGDYNRRRSECEEAAQRLGVVHLCELGLRDLPRLSTLPEPLFRRARHVITENARVPETAQALSAADPTRLKRLFADSHESQRRDFEVSLPLLDDLVAAADAEPNILAARLTGGGFGGSIVALALSGQGRVAAREVVERAGAKRARVILPT